MRAIKGSSLIEVLLAMSMIALASVGCQRAWQQGARWLAAERERTEILQWAERLQAVRTPCELASWQAAVHNTLAHVEVQQIPRAGYVCYIFEWSSAYDGRRQQWVVHTLAPTPTGDRLPGVVGRPQLEQCAAAERRHAVAGGQPTVAPAARAKPANRPCSALDGHLEHGGTKQR